MEKLPIEIQCITVLILFHLYILQLVAAHPLHGLTFKSVVVRTYNIVIVKFGYLLILAQMICFKF